MWHSVIFSRIRRQCRTAAGPLGLVIVGIAAAPGAFAGSLISVENALASAFPSATFERETIFLNEHEMDRVETDTGMRPTSALVTRFEARSGENLVGWAYLDTHRVRTLPETVMIFVGLDATVIRVEVVVFREPMDYLPPDSWYAQYEDRALDEELQLKRGIRPITGATLTARATTNAVRKVLSIHSSLLNEGESP